MRNLNERRLALKMHYEDGKSYSEISKVMQISENTLKTWCRRHRPENYNPAIVPLIAIPIHDKNQKKACDIKIDKRVKQLEMQVKLLQDFLLEEERRLIKR